jgi:hypothetical protein
MFVILDSQSSSGSIFHGPEAGFPHTHEFPPYFLPGRFFNYTIIGLIQDNTTDPPNIEMPDNYINWRSLDFSGISMDRFAAHLQSFMHDLAQKDDPLNEVRFRGDCTMDGAVHPEGGSGIVLSLRTVEWFAQWRYCPILGFWLVGKDLRLGRLTNTLL